MSLAHLSDSDLDRVVGGTDPNAALAMMKIWNQMITNAGIVGSSQPKPNAHPDPNDGFPGGWAMIP